MAGFSRSAIVHQMPDAILLKQDIESYPEIKKVEYKEEEPHGPWRDGYCLDYQGDKIAGTICFRRNDKNQITYSQSLYMMGGPPPWMRIPTISFMKKIERDLETKFELPEIEPNLKVTYVMMSNPEKEAPSDSSLRQNTPIGQ